MLISHISFSLGLIALVAGASLYLWSVRAEAGPGIALAKIIGIIVMVLSILELIGSVYSGATWRHHKQEWREKNTQQTSTNGSTSPNSESDGSTNTQVNNPDTDNAPTQNSTPSTTQPKSS